MFYHTCVTIFLFDDANHLLSKKIKDAMSNASIMSKFGNEQIYN